jgi:NAD(P)H-hydrate epimerase
VGADLPAREAAARRVAERFGAVLVLKGRFTLVDDGEVLAVNPTGSPGLATGGTGDVLTGVVAALIGQGLTAFGAACLGAHVHGLAGDLAAEKLTQVSLTAWDLLDFLPGAMREAVS